MINDNIRVMNGRCCIRRAGAAVRSAALSVALLGLFVGGAQAGDPLAAYGEEVAGRARRVVEAAVPGNDRALAAEVQILRKTMLARGILSINALPDMVFERAAREGWKKDAGGVLRILAPVSALSVPMWAWLVKDDLAGFRLAPLLEDARALVGAVRRFGPASVGYAAWLVSFISAAACWFAAWTGAALFIRARPSLEYDIFRMAKRVRGAEYFALLFAVFLFLLPAAAGAGIGVAVPVWILFAMPYLRLRELAAAGVALLLLAGVVIGGGVSQSLRALAADGTEKKWLAADGFLPSLTERGAGGASKDLVEGVRAWAERYGRARAAMQYGDLQAAERGWTELLAEGKAVPDVYNNRGVVRARGGRFEAAMADFEEAVARDPEHPQALWNLYQLYLIRFHIDRARLVQPLAWERIETLQPFRYRPAELDQGEWVSSPLPAGEIWRGYLGRSEGLVSLAARNEPVLRFLRPFGPRGMLLLLAAVAVATAAFRAWTWKGWTSCTCRACGAQLTISGSREKADVCTPCRSQVPAGVREGQERTRRLLGIAMHGRFVRLASLAVPGSAGFWAGKELRTVLFGGMLSLSLAGLSASLAGVRSSSALILALQSIVFRLAAGAAVLLWAAGAAWGAWSFAQLERRCNVGSAGR